MKNFLNILSICAIFLSFGAIKAIGNDLDEVICNAMKGMQAQEEKKIPYKIGNYELIGLIVDCKNKALITEKNISNICYLTLLKIIRSIQYKIGRLLIAKT